MRHGKPVKERIFVLVISQFYSWCCLFASAQQTTEIPRIGFISFPGTPANPHPCSTHSEGDCSDLGFVDGKNIMIESRYAEGRLDRMPGLVNDLVQQKVDVIVAANNALIRAAKEATKTIPIVMLSSVDPVAAGYVEALHIQVEILLGLPSWS